MLDECGVLAARRWWRRRAHLPAATSGWSVARYRLTSGSAGGPALSDRSTSTSPAPADIVFDVLSEPYLGRQTRAVAEKIRILERGSDMVLAAHRTPVRGRLVATTVETVRFTRPERVDFRLLRGPVPHVVEQFRLTADGARTRLEYSGELGTDLWALGARWGNLVARPWQRTVAATFAAVKAEAERRADNRRGVSRHT